MKLKRNAVMAILLTLFVSLSCCFLWLRHTQGTQSIPMDSMSRIASIYILTKENGVQKTHSLSGEDFPSGLEDDLLQCMGQYSMTNAQISTPQSMELSDPYIYISIWIFNMDGTSFRVNVSDNEFHSSVQIGKKHFGIVHSGLMLEDIKSILSRADVQV